MSEAIIGAAIGGVIGIISSILIIYNDRKKLAITLKHEKDIRQFELFEKPRQVALIEYAEALGAVASVVLEANAVDRYFSAYERVCIYISPSEREVLALAHKLFMVLRMDSYSQYNESSELSFSTEYSAARETIYQLLHLKKENE